MKRLCLALAVGFAASFASTEAHAIQFFWEVFEKTYAAGDTDFAKAAKAAKCNVCHVQGEAKKVRNPYGNALHDFLEKDNFKKDRIESERAKAEAEVVEGLKKGGEKKNAAGKTFAELITGGKLPGVQ